MERNNVRSQHTTVFTQQLQGKKKMDVTNCPALLAKKSKKTTTKAISSIFRSSTVSDVHVCA
jgi:hypothetical protein